MRRRKAVLLGGVLALTGIAAAVALASSAMAPMSFKASLNTRQQVPKEKGASVRAGGRFTAKLAGTKFTWKLTFRHLTGFATAAHIHTGKKGVAGSIIIELCDPCKSPAKGTAHVSKAVAKRIESGQTYVNVHTEKNPGGEIRGQIKAHM
jgi:hypothetical protein